MNSDSILFCGDVHSNFEHVVDVVLKHSPAAIVLLGDLQPKKPLDVELREILEKTEIWFIHGNHDTDSDGEYFRLFDSKLADRNLHGRVVQIAGMRIAGLGGVFRGSIWAPPAPWAFETQDEYTEKCRKIELWREGMPRKHHSSIFPADYFNLAGQRADILVTHEAPSSHPHGYDAIDELTRSLGATKSFHGHHHDRLNYSKHYARLRFEAHGVGFRGITDLAGRVVRPGNFDEESRTWKRHFAG